MSGEDHLRGVAQWIALRQEALTEVLGLVKPQAPHTATYSRMLRHAVDIEELERVAREFFAHQPQAGQSVVISLDGKTLRGTIPAGQSKGVRLLPAYLPEEGWALFQGTTTPSPTSTKIDVSDITSTETLPSSLI